jgi:hypothetical protein
MLTSNEDILRLQSSRMRSPIVGVPAPLSSAIRVTFADHVDKFHFADIAYRFSDQRSFELPSEADGRYRRRL